jgi:hypothetical protein
MATRMQQRRGTASQWTTANPILAAGEIGFETDTNQFKMGDGTNTWANLSYFKNLEDLGGSLDDYLLVENVGQAGFAASLDVNGYIPVTQLGNLIGDAPEILDTLEELADSLTNIDGDINTRISNNNITQREITNDDIQSAIAMEQTERSNEIEDSIASAISLESSARTLEIDNAIASEVLARDNAITQSASTLTGDLETFATDAADAAQSAAQTAAQGYVSDHNSDTTNVHGISDTSLLATKSYADTAEADAITAAGTAADSKVAAAVAALTKSSVGLSNVDNTSDANKPVSTATQTALDAKLASATAATVYAPIESPTFTGTVAGVTKAHVGLGNVNNTSDANKPVSTATQTALDAKASLAGATFTGDVEVDGSLVVDGNFTVNGTNFSASATTITIEDNLVQLAHQNAGNTVDLGIVVGYNDGSAKHSGIVRDVSDDTWKLFKGVTTEPTTTVNFGQGSLDNLSLAGLTATSITVGDVSNTEFGYLNGVTSAIQTQLDAKIASATAASTYETITNVALKAPIAAPTFTGLTTVSASGIAFTDGTQIAEGVPSRTVIIQRTASNTLSGVERDDLIEMGSSSAMTLTIPADSTFNFPVGTSIDVLQTSTGQVTIAGAGGVTVNATPGLKLRTQWSSATLFKRAANTWVVFGDLSA